MKIGMQMVSMKYEKCREDICDIISDLGDMGYEGVEFARGFFGKTAEQLKKTLDQKHMAAVSNHVFFEDMADKRKLDHILRECHILQMEQVVACTADPLRGQESEAAHIQKLYEIADVCSREGIKLAIHGSLAYYRKDASGKPLFDRILCQIPDNLLMAQVDTAWALCGGEVPSAYIMKWAGRIKTVHFKDCLLPENTFQNIGPQMAADVKNCPVGHASGALCLSDTVAACKKAGVEWLIVEQDERDSYDDSLADAKISFENIRREL